MSTTMNIHNVKSIRLKSAESLRSGTEVRELVIETGDGDTFEITAFKHHGVDHIEVEDCAARVNGGEMAIRMYGAEAEAGRIRDAAKEALHDLDRQPSPADARKRARATLRGALKAPVAAQEDT